jgi:hypothetical protein
MVFSLLGLFLAAVVLSLQLSALESMSWNPSSMMTARFSFARSALGLTMTQQRPSSEKIAQKIATVSGVTSVGLLASQWRSLLQALQSLQEQQHKEEEELRGFLAHNSTLRMELPTASFKEVDKALASLCNNQSTGAMTYLQTLTAGAVSRSMAQTLLHPAYTYKTLLQLKNVGHHIPKPSLSNLQFARLLKGIDAQFLLSLPHGAFHFFVIDQVSFIMIF